MTTDKSTGVRFQGVTLFPGIVEGRALPVLQDAVVVVNNGFFVYAGPGSAAPAMKAGERVIDGHGKLLMPSFSNAHAHSAMTLLRGAGADLPLKEWLFDTIFPLEARLTAQVANAGVQMSVLEYLACGVTTVNDMYMFPQETAKVFGEAGMRALICDACVDFGNGDEQLHNALLFHQEFHNSYSGRIKASVSLHAEYTTTPDLVKKLVDASEGLDNVVHVHLSETAREVAECAQRYGKTPVQYFADLGLFNMPSIAAHCVAVNQQDMEILAKHNVAIALNPVSNLKLGSGVAPVSAMQRHGISLAIGTDGAASNDNLNLLEEIKLTGILHKGVQGDCTVVSPEQVLEMATVKGARAMGFDNVGLIQAGWQADCILVNMKEPNLSPYHDLCAALVYAMQSHNICLTMASGIVLYENGQYPLLDKERILTQAAEQALLLKQRSS